MPRRPRKALEIFSLSFLDCICCGFGAVLLLFVLSAGQQRNTYQANELEIAEAQAILVEARAQAQKKIAELSQKLEIERSKKSDTVILADHLAEQIARLSEKLEKVKEQLKQVPVPSSVPVPTPTTGNTPYLDVFSLAGKRILFIVESSGGMLGKNAEEVGAVQSGIFASSEKWTGAKNTLIKLISDTPEEGQIAVYAMAETFFSLHPNKSWFATKDKADFSQVLKAIETLPAAGAANLELACQQIAQMSPFPDQVVFLVDGLPTTSLRRQPSGMVTPRDREEFFRNAYAQLPMGIPISVVLFPFADDLDGVAYWWALTAYSGGTLISGGN